MASVLDSWNAEGKGEAYWLNLKNAVRELCRRKRVSMRFLYWLAHDGLDEFREAMEVLLLQYMRDHTVNVDYDISAEKLCEQIGFHLTTAARNHLSNGKFGLSGEHAISFYEFTNARMSDDEVYRHFEGKVCRPATLVETLTWLGERHRRIIIPKDGIVCLGYGDESVVVVRAFDDLRIVEVQMKSRNKRTSTTKYLGVYL